MSCGLLSIQKATQEKPRCQQRQLARSRPFNHSERNAFNHSFFSVHFWWTCAGHLRKTIRVNLKAVLLGSSPISRFTAGLDIFFHILIPLEQFKNQHYNLNRILVDILVGSTHVFFVKFGFPHNQASQAFHPSVRPKASCFYMWSHFPK